MSEHRDLGGDSLHEPKGRYPTPLTLGSEATAYLIQDSDSNALFQIDGVAGAIKVGNSVTKPPLQELSGGVLINADAAASANEDPYLVLLGGDGVTAPSNDILRSWLIQDSSAETLNLYLERSRNGGSYATIGMAFHIGKIGETATRQPSIVMNDGSGSVARSWTLQHVGSTGVLSLTSGTSGAVFSVGKPVEINGSLSIINTANALTFGQGTINFGDTSVPLSTLNLIQAAHGAYYGISALEELVTLSTGSVTTDTVIQIPANSILRGVTVKTQTALVGASAYDVGIAGNTTKFATSVATSKAAPIAPELVASATSVRLTANGVPSAGRVRVTIHYETLTASTS